MKDLQDGFKELCALLEPNETPYDIIRWHVSSKWLYDVCTKPQLLYYVEDFLGPNFYLWGTGFFAKPPHTEDTVPWNQDSYYWPLSPHRTVSVWLAFEDVDEKNGAMKVVPGTHKAGLLKHVNAEDENNKLKLELERGSFDESAAVSLVLKAGQVSIHDDAMVHGSPANLSGRWRTGMAIRFSSTEVKCDTEKWPHFKAYLVRGIDEFDHNPKGVIPEQQFARPAQKIVIAGVNEDK